MTVAFSMAQTTPKQEPGSIHTSNPTVIASTNTAAFCILQRETYDKGRISARLEGTAWSVA